MNVEIASSDPGFSHFFGLAILLCNGVSGWDYPEDNPVCNSVVLPPYFFLALSSRAKINRGKKHYT
jgi:hypothetical protein